MAGVELSMVMTLTALTRRKCDESTRLLMRRVPRDACLCELASADVRRWGLGGQNMEGVLVGRRHIADASERKEYACYLKMGALRVCACRARAD